MARRIDRVVLLSLVPADRWADVAEIAAQLGATALQVSTALADAIADGERIDASGTTYRRYVAGELPTPAPIVRSSAPPVHPQSAQPSRPSVTPTPTRSTRGIETSPHARPPRDAPVLFSQMLAQRRIACGLSQNTLAREAGIDPAYVNRLERRTSFCQPSRHVVLALADALGLDGAGADRLLYAAGSAPVRNYQTIAEEALRRLALVEAALSGLGALDLDGETVPAVRRVG